MLDLTLQLVALGTGIVPVFLVAHFLPIGRGLSRIGIDLRHLRSDLLRGAAIAAVIGGSGLALYLGAHAAGVDLTVVAEALPVVWWRIPVLLLSALQNAPLEEVWFSATCCIG